MAEKNGRMGPLNHVLAAVGIFLHDPIDGFGFKQLAHVCTYHIKSRMYMYHQAYLAPHVGPWMALF